MKFDASTDHLPAALEIIFDASTDDANGLGGGGLLYWDTEAASLFASVYPHDTIPLASLVPLVALVVCCANGSDTGG